MKIDELKVIVDKLQALLDDPQPGLMTWNDFLRQRMTELVDGWNRPKPTTEPTVFMCQNCGTLYTEDELDPLDDVSERVAPGDTMPWGQCPDEGCAAVCYPPENMTPEEIAQQLKEQEEDSESEDEDDE